MALVGELMLGDMRLGGRGGEEPEYKLPHDLVQKQRQQQGPRIFRIFVKGFCGSRNSYEFHAKAWGVGY